MNINHTKALHFPGLGNGLVADQDLEPGDVIIGIAEPYLLVVELAALDRVCSQCFTAAPNGLKRCGACKIVQYCSAACQSTAWKSIHKEECRIFRKLPRAPSTAVRALMQLLLRGVVAGGSSDPRWVRLESHTSELQRNNRWDDILLQAKVAVEWTASPNEYMESVVNVICRVSFGPPSFSLL
jgi:SET and MYND domain-containing protein